MLKFESSAEGKRLSMLKLKQALEPLGFTVGGNWDYDHGYMDLKVGDTEGNQYLRLPILAVDGQLEDESCIVEIGKPFLLSHVYDGEEDIDEEGNVGNVSASFNQFKEPKNKDAEFPAELIDWGKGILIKVESELENV